MRIAWLYLVQYLKARLAYRWDFLAQVLGDLMVSAAGLSFLAGIFAGAGVTAIGGWPRDAILFIYGFSMISVGVLEFFAESLYRFSEEYLIEGRFDQVLLRPFSPFLQVLLHSFNPLAVTEIMVGGALVAWSGARLPVDWTVGHAAAAALLALSGGVIITSVFLVLTCVNFWFEDRLGIQPPVFNCIVFGRYPIEIFHPAVRILLQTVIPFAFIGYYPAGLLIAGERWGDGTRQVALLTPVVAVVFALMAGLVWRAGIRRYHSTGS